MIVNILLVELCLIAILSIINLINNNLITI